MFTRKFLDETIDLIKTLDINEIEEQVSIINSIREKNGRLFICGAGGSAGHASHAVNDFRKLTELEAYSPTDNVSEVTARTNDEGWDTVYREYLKVSKLNSNDAIYIFSVGGGSHNPPVSKGLVEAIKYAKDVRAKVLGIVGRDGGFTKQEGDSVILIPSKSKEYITPQTEGITAIIWHLIVTHPLLKKNPTKW